MAFDQEAVLQLFSDVVSVPLSLGLFDQVNQNEPKSAPGNGLTCAIWIQDIRPVGRASGLNSTSGVITFSERLYTSFVSSDSGQIDPNMLTACTTLLGAYTGEFTLEGDARAIDLLGMYGAPMSATAGYLDQDGKMYRIMTVTLPVIINDLWTQEA